MSKAYAKLRFPCNSKLAPYGGSQHFQFNRFPPEDLFKMFNCFFLSWLLFIFISLQVPVFNCNKFGYVPAMYVFGDSLVDSGNNNYLVKSPKQNFLPYGIDFGGTPTGRATNGKTIADFIASFLNLPLSPPYMGLSEIQRQNVTTGINYASARCGILPETASKGSCLSLDSQMELFQRSVEVDLPKHYKNPSKLEDHLSKSLFFVSIGVNDFFFIYVPSLNKTGKHLPSNAFAHFLVNQLSMRLQRLYNLGARKFLVNNLPPAGCIPAEVVKLKKKLDCNEESNGLVNSYNRILPDMLQRLQKHLHGAIFSHSDYYNFLLNLRQTAKLHGITHRWKSCCPENIHVGRVQCLPHSSFCENRDRFLFFDAFHPSQIANFIYAIHCLNDSTVCSPFNIQQLAAA